MNTEQKVWVGFGVILIFSMIVFVAGALATTETDPSPDEQSKLLIEVGSPVESFKIVPIDLPKQVKPGDTIYFKYKLTEIPGGGNYEYLVMVLSHAPGKALNNLKPECLSSGNPAFYKADIKTEKWEGMNTPGKWKITDLRTSKTREVFVPFGEYEENIRYTIPSSLPSQEVLDSTFNTCSIARCFGDPAYGGVNTCSEYYLVVQFKKAGTAETVGNNFGRFDFAVRGIGITPEKTKAPASFECVLPTDSRYLERPCASGEICTSDDGFTSSSACKSTTQCTANAQCLEKFGKGYVCGEDKLCKEDTSTTTIELKKWAGFILAGLGALIIIYGLIRGEGPAKSLTERFRK